MRYEMPGAVEEVARLLSGEEGVIRILAGGTDVIAQLNSGFVEPDLVIDIKGLPGFRDITAENGGYRIGAAVPCAEMSEHPGLKALWPGVVEAAALIGSTQIQGRATIVGNLCNGSPAADSVPALVAADAVATIVGAGWPPRTGRRRHSFRPGKDGAGPVGDHRVGLPACASATIGRRLSAFHTAHRDGHRGGRRRRQSHPR